MVFDSRRLSRQSAIPATPESTKAPATAPTEDAPPGDDATPRSKTSTTSRLKKMSGATARRFSRPLSLVSGRSTSSTRQRTPNKLQKSSTRNSIASRTSRAEGESSSRRSSLLSTRGSSSVQGEEDRFGELPVFGVAQRAYLASLVSLFGSSNGATYSASSPITDPSSGAPSLGPYEFDIHSPAIYKYEKVRRLYVGWPELVHPPPEALLEFEMETLPLLERDLQGISGHLGQQGIRLTYELRMSGYASASGETVTMSPTVWILYRAYSSVGSQVSVAELHQAVADIFYLQKGLEIQEGGGRIELSSDRGLVNIKVDDKESVKLSDGAKLSVHVEDCHDKYTVCGALCCVTTDEGSKRMQGLCRIGGLLKINGKYILGVTTAHAMLDGSGIFRDSFDDAANSHTSTGQAVDRDVIMSESRRVSKWHNVTRDAAVDFLGISMNSRGEMAINRSKPENATDFALLRLRKMPGYVRNKYIPPRAQEAISITSTASASAAAMDEGPVYILRGGGEVADGQLIWGSACFIVRGRNFRVRRIQTSRPLSAGTTGAWVVRGEVLYGVIIAVYENEPFALMMTVERLFASILGSAFSIRSVELWDGEIPDVLKGMEEQAQSSKQQKRVVPVQTRRRAKTETGGNRNGEGSSRDVPQVTGESSKSRPDTAPEGIQPLSPRPQTADEATQTEELYVPINHSHEAERPVSKPVESASATPKATRRPRADRSVSHSSETSMSGAIPDDTPIPVSPRKQRCDTGDSAVSTGAHTTYTTASETLNRQDSGFDSEASPPQQADGAPHHHEETQRPRGLQAPPIRPPTANANASDPRHVSLRGGASHDAGLSENSEEAGWSGGFPSRTTTATGPKSRRTSLQAVLDKTFRRPSSKRQAQDERDVDHDSPPRSNTGTRRSSAMESERLSRGDNNFGIPPTGLDGSRPLSSFFRRSSAKAPEGEVSNQGTGDGESTSQPLSFQRRSSSRAFEAAQNDNFGIPPTGLDGSRPLSSMLRRSSGKAPEIGQSNQETRDGAASTSNAEKPSSFIGRSVAKPKQPEQPSKDNNFGIPPQGL